MSLFFVCFVLPALVMSLNNTYINITSSQTYTEAFYNTSVSNTLVFRNYQNESSKVKITNPVTHNVENSEYRTKSISNIPQRLHKQKKNIPKNSNMSHPEIIPMAMNEVVKPIKRDLQDMPLASDLEEIMDSINNVLDFFMENEKDIDLSMNYGLFLLNVNLQTVFLNKRSNLPPGISFNLRTILEKIDKLLKFFKNMVDSYHNPEDELSRSLTTLFNHERLWMSRIQKFDGAHINKTVFEEYSKLQNRYSYWEKYLDNMGDFNKARPRPDQSNTCLSYLANNHASRDSWKRKCQIPNQCAIPLAKGSDYGYGLTHRLLFLQLAYYGYRCYVFSNTKDGRMRAEFCKQMYDEATYISYHDFGAVDLFVEQICLCALDGHYQFLHRSWLNSIISFQTEAGCFSDVPAEKRPPRPPYEGALLHKWELDKGENQYILGGHCNGHTSSAAVATLGFGVKFILEAYY